MEVWIDAEYGVRQKLHNFECQWLTVKEDILYIVPKVPLYRWYCASPAALSCDDQMRGFLNKHLKIWALAWTSHLPKCLQACMSWQVCDVHICMGMFIFIAIITQVTYFRAIAFLQHHVWKFLHQLWYKWVVWSVAAAVS